MKKILLILVFSLLVVCISFSVFVQGGRALTVNAPVISEQEDWEKKYYNLKAEYDAIVYYIENEIRPALRSLESKVKKAESDLDSLKADYAALEADYAALEVRYKLALSQLETRTTWMYVFIVTTVVFVATTLYLALRRPKPQPKEKP